MFLLLGWLFSHFWGGMRFCGCTIACGRSFNIQEASVFKVGPL